MLGSEGLIRQQLSDRRLHMPSKPTLPSPPHPQSASLGSSLEPSTAEMRQLLDVTSKRLVAYIESLAEQPASDFADADLVAASARQDWPEEPLPFDDLRDQLFDELTPKSMLHPGPGFLGFIPGGGLFHSALANLIASVINRYVTVWAAAPALVQLEMNVIRWFCRIVGYPSTAGGFLASGGSMANFSALVAARRELLPENFLQGTLYVCEHTHHSVHKAALMAGFPSSGLRTVPADDAFRMRPEALEAQIEADRQQGLQPFFVVGNGGSTNTGAVDPLPEMAAIAARQGLWFHIDAAYGGFFALTERGRQRLAGMELADSITLDPHKSLFVPYGTGCLLVKDLNKLRRAHSVGADYMPKIQDDPERIDFSEISPELSRSFRGLGVWLPIKMVGVDPFRAALDEKLDLAQWITEQLRTVEGLDIVAEPQLSTLAFRLRRDAFAGAPGFDGLDDDALDGLSQRLLDIINAKQRVFLTGTRLAGRFVIRICVLGLRTHGERMKMCLEDIQNAVTQVIAEVHHES